MIAAINIMAISVKFIIRPKWCRNAGRMSTMVEATKS
jgi:hypothetical protein